MAASAGLTYPVRNALTAAATPLEGHQLRGVAEGPPLGTAVERALPHARVGGDAPQGGEGLRRHGHVVRSVGDTGPRGVLPSRPVERHQRALVRQAPRQRAIRIRLKGEAGEPAEHPVHDLPRAAVRGGNRRAVNTGRRRGNVRALPVRVTAPTRHVVAGNGGEGEERLQACPRRGRRRGRVAAAAGGAGAWRRRARPPQQTRPRPPAAQPLPVKRRV